MAFSPTPKNPGDLIRSQDWNEAMGEVVRLESAKLSLTGGNINGPLSVSTLSVGTATPPNRPLTIRGTAGTYLNVIANNGTHEVLLGADNAGGIVSTMTNHDLQLRAGGNVTRLTVKADGNVGVGTTSPVSTLQVKSLTAINEAVTGAGAWANFGSNVFLDGAWKRIDTNKAGVNLHMNADGGGQEFRFLRIEANGQQLRNIAVIGTGVSYISESKLGIGTTTPGFALDVTDRIRLRQGPSGTAGLWLFQTAPNVERAFIGMVNDNAVGFWGNNGIGWGLVMSTSTGELSVRGPLLVQQAHTIKLGVPAGPYGNDGIRGEPNLWLDAAGTVFIKAGFQARGMDVAERFKTAEQVEAGQVVIFDEPAEAVKLCDRAYDSRVIGIASAEPAFILGIDPEHMPIALCGRVPCNVDADIAPIAVGDLLTTSPTRGYAQKVIASEKAAGATIGKALGALKSGKGQILVLVLPR